MIKTGIVTQVNKNIVYLMTTEGEFVKVKSKGAAPSIGEIFSGELYTERKPVRLPALAAAMLSFIILGSGLYTYYTPVAAITIDINPSVELQINRWNRIIKASPLNEDGKKVLSNISVANKSPEQGLEMIVSQAEKENFINEDYKASDKVISVHVVEKKEDQVDLSRFQAVVEKQNLKVTIKEELKEKKDSTKQNAKEADKTAESLNNNKTNVTDTQNGKNEDSKEKNKGQENKESKASEANDKADDKTKNENNTKNPNSNNDNLKDQNKNNSASENNQLNSSKDEKKEEIVDKKEEKKQDKEEKKGEKDSKPSNGSSSGNGNKNEKENKKTN
jgi:hypothetical protein